MKKKNLIILTILMLATMLSIVLSIIGLVFVDNFIINTVILPIVASLTVSIVLICLSTLTSHRSIKQEQKEVEKYYEVITERVKKEANILELMLANMKEIKEYYVLSKSQAKKSFTVAIAMGIMGFILIATSIMLAIFYSGNLAASLIPAIGAAIVDLLSAVFLFVYKKSLEQLNHYYSELHDNEQFLSAVNLVDKISSEKQDEVLTEIIRSRINIKADS